MVHNTAVTTVALLCALSSTCQSEICSLCQGSAYPTLPDNNITLNVNNNKTTTLTCAKAYKLAPTGYFDSCDIFIDNNPCQCPNITTAITTGSEYETCSLCPNGTYSNNNVTFQNTTLNCGFFYNLTDLLNSSSNNDNGGSCIDFRNEIDCSCNSNNNNNTVCSLCGNNNGTSLPEPNLLVGRATCSEWEASIIEEDECSSWQNTLGPYCGCENVTTSTNYCSICGDNPLVNPAASVTLSSTAAVTTTCLELERIVNSNGGLSDSECFDQQNKYANDCGCFFTNVCTLCPEGNYPNDPSAKFKFIGPNGDDLVINCSLAYDLAPQGYFVNCSNLQAKTSALCSCDNNMTYPTCSLCGDNQDLVDSTKVVAQRSCEEWQTIARNDFPENCLSWQYSLGPYCLCPTIEKLPSDYCSICVDENFQPKPFPDPDRMVTYQSGITRACVAVEQEINSIVGDGLSIEDCSKERIKYGTACGCTTSTKAPSASTNTSEKTFVPPMMLMSVVFVIPLLLSFFV